LDLDGAGVVVSGRSGAGKSTICGRFADEWCNEEYAYVVPVAGQWEVWHLLGYRARPGATVRRSPLRRVWLLSSDRDQTAALPALGGDGIAGLVANTILPESGNTLGLVCDNAARLVSSGLVAGLAHSLATPVAALRAVLTSSNPVD
jgi:GTPase SAR1 family protein